MGKRMGQILIQPYALCPQCMRKFAVDERECAYCTTAVYAGGFRLHVRLWRRIPRADGTAQVLPPEAIPPAKKGGVKWGVGAI
jgi:hypothetical protein